MQALTSLHLTTKKAKLHSRTFCFTTLLEARSPLLLLKSVVLQPPLTWNTLSFGVGDTVTVNGATVTLPDVATSNGVIHVIDKVLMPTDTPNDIPRTAQCTGIHDSLVAAVIQAELLETLKGDGPFTIFAPTDQAFADAGIDLASLDTPEGKGNLVRHPALSRRRWRSCINFA